MYCCTLVKTQVVFETNLVVWISEISDHDGYQVSGESCWEVGPAFV